MSYRPTLRFNPDIQELRGLAVMLVVLCHAGVPALQGGFVGVDVFFVLSGYLITGLLLTEYQERGAIHYSTFIVRRLRRLLPALAVMLMGILALGSLLLSGYEFSNQSQSALFAATWTSNVFFALRDIDYFVALQSQDLFLHTWSLGVEEQFYIIWPLILIAFLRMTNSGRLRTGPSGPLVVLLGVLTIVSLGLCFLWAGTSPLLSFYMMPSRVWQFALGALVFLWMRQRDACGLVVYRPGFRLLGIGMILGSAAFLHEEMVYPGGWALLPSLGTAAVLASGTGDKRPGHRSGLLGSVMMWLGDRSYSLYLWHWPVLLLGLTLMPAQIVTGTVVSLVLALIVAAASYRFVELPVWKGNFSGMDARATFAASAALMLCAGVVALGMTSGREERIDSTARDSGYDPRQDAPPIYSAGFRCDTGHFTDDIEPCSIGSPQAPRTLVLFGDSVVAQWVSAIPEIFSPPEWQVIVLTKSACPMVDEDYFYSRIGETYKICAAWRVKALEHIQDLQPDIVIVGSDSEYPLSEQQWTAGSTRIFSALSRSAGKVAVIPGTPGLSFDGPSCLENPSKFRLRTRGGRRPCEEMAADNVAGHVDRYLRSAANGIPNLSVVSFDDIVCPDGYCAAMTGEGSVVFRDKKHVTNSFVIAQTPVIRSRLAEAGLGP